MSIGKGTKRWRSDLVIDIDIEERERSLTLSFIALVGIGVIKAPFLGYLKLKTQIRGLGGKW
jgi:hypothetical protein